MKYPFVKCLNPQYVRNKYTGEKLIVSCGKCEACLSKKSAMSTLKCRLESKFHKYSRFITLTYNEFCLPRMELQNIETLQLEPSGSTFYPLYHLGYVEYTGRLAQSSPRCLGMIKDIVQHRVVADKVNNERLPHLSKRDLQLFLKRLRKYISDYGKKHQVKVGQIRYFCCGEYGPVHFRPHYHIILWFSCEQINQIISDAVSACWSYGRISTEIPRDDVSSYVANYVNSYCTLPEIYRQPETKPFTIHSQHLGEKFFQSEREKIYEAPVAEVVRKCSVVANTYTEVYMWRSLEAYYFPRCKMYDVFDTQKRLYAYTIERSLQKWTGKEKITEQVKYFLDYVHGVYHRFRSVVPFWNSDLNVNDMITFLIAYCNIDVSNLHVQEIYDYSYRSLYMVLRTSRHFIRFVCNNNPNYFLKYVNLIDKHYKDVELLRLNDRYGDFEDNFGQYFTDEEEYSLLFLQHDNVPNAIMQTDMYKKYYASVNYNFRNSMKHKKLNDLNRIFENY